VIPVTALPVVSNKKEQQPSFSMRPLTMIYALSLFVLLAAAIMSLRILHPRETRMVLSAIIDLPASAVFEVIGDVTRLPSWGRHPHWLPRPLRISTMSRWGEHIPLDQRSACGRHTAPEEIRIRCLHNQELGYQSLRRRELSFESTFRLTPDSGKCQLTWEVRFQTHRLPDILGRKTIANAARASMASSLEYIQRLALYRPDAICARSGMYETHRDHIPAA
jgi:hypothetical protein